MTRSRLPSSWVGAACLLATVSAIAGDDPREPDWVEPSSTFEQAREAVARGEILPLDRMRERLRQIRPGKIVSTKFEHEFDRWVYEFKVIDTDGQLKKVHLDARDGELVKISDY